MRVADAARIAVAISAERLRRFLPDSPIDRQRRQIHRARRQHACTQNRAVGGTVRNITALGNLLADDYLHVHTSAMTQDKPTYLKGLGNSPRQTYRGGRDRSGVRRRRRDERHAVQQIGEWRHPGNVHHPGVGEEKRRVETGVVPGDHESEAEGRMCKRGSHDCHAHDAPIQLSFAVSRSHAACCGPVWCATCQAATPERSPQITLVLYGIGDHPMWL